MRHFIFLATLCLSAYADQIPKIHYQLNNDPLDVIIPSTRKDLATLDACIEGIKAHGQNIRRIIVVSSEKLTDHAEWFDERRFPFTPYDIALQIFKDPKNALHYMRLKNNRLGWKYQQLLKLYAAFVIPNISTNILILDSDTIFLTDVFFLDQQSNALFQVRDEYHIPYFEHLMRLIPGVGRVFEEHSGIAHHMVFQKAVLDDLFAHIQARHQTEVWKAICDAIDREELLGSCFSEYEIYFNFVFSRTDQMKLRKLKMIDSGECENLQSFKDQGYGYVSCHTWMRE